MTAQICGANNRQGKPCGRPAGWGTDHVGAGRCKLHGGNGGRPIIHGRYSVKARDLAKKLQAFRDDPEPGSLLDELALLRGLLQTYLDGMDKVTAESTGHAVGLVDAIAKLVERVSRIQNANAVTAAEVTLMLAFFQDVILKFVPADQRLALLQELKRFSGSLPTLSEGIDD